jgi:DNA adenine methylase
MFTFGTIGKMNLDPKVKKANFLEDLRGKNLKYKRYLGSTLRYGGGKSLAVGDIIELIPDNVKRVVSPFMGGGSIEIALSKELGIEVIAYDIFDLLVNFWNQQLNHPVELYTELSKLKPTKEEYARIKGILHEHFSKESGYDGQLDPLTAAAYYYFNMELSFGPAFLGWMSEIYTDERKYKATIEKVRDFKDSHLSVYNERFENSVPKHNGDFLYLDPPYYLGGDSKMFDGLYPSRSIPIHHKGFNHEKLAELLHEHKGGFIMSYNDCSFVREAYKDFEIREISWQYTMGQGEKRIGKFRKERDYDNGNVKTSHEVLIMNI